MARPFLKWAGGKSQLLKEICKHLPKKYNKYYEPFVGGGAVFFFMRPGNAILSDSNGCLIRTYSVVRDQVEDLIQILEKYPNDEDFYYDMRKLNSAELPDLQRAARFIFLNKTCFNGLYRVNSKNEFNVPFGKYKNPLILDKGNLRSCSKLLQGVTLEATYFYKSSILNANQGDFIYMDPPYVPVSETSFVGYSKKGFNLEQHEKLAKLFEESAAKGVFVLLSNSDVPWVRERYSNFNIIEVNARRSINSKGSGRGKVGELLIRSY